MKSHYRGGLVGPVLLIGLGFILLGQTLGLVGGEIWWNLLRMWPLILIAIGVDLLIPRRSALGTFVALLLVLAVFAGGFLLSGVRVRPVSPGDVEALSIPVYGAERAVIHLDPPVAALDLHALEGSDALVEGTVPKYGYGRLDARSRLSGTTAIVEITSSGVFITPAIGPQDETWRVGLSSEVPLDLQLSSGVGLIDADLTGMTVTALDVEIGIGRTVITLPEGASFSGRVSGAIGQTVIIFPRGTAIRATMTTGLGGVETPDGNRPFDLGDNEYTSPGYESAENRVELEIEQAIGSIVLREG
jgi:LiaF transmembrane domain